MYSKEPTALWYLLISANLLSVPSFTSAKMVDVNDKSFYVNPRLPGRFAMFGTTRTKIEIWPLG